MGLRERKQINNLPHYKEGLVHMPVGGEGWGNAVSGAANFATNAVNSFGPTKTASTMMNDAGTSTGYGSGFTYQRQNSVNGAQQMNELSKENTGNTLKTAAAGATLGASFGPIGAAAGLVLGGVVGLIGGGARKREMLNQIKNAKLKTSAFNDYSFAAGQSDFLEQDYNTRYDNSQDDLIYHAKNGKMPNVRLANGLQPNAMVSNGEIIGHVDNQGNVIDAMRVGIGKDNKDTVPVHLAGGKEPSDNSFVITNKGGISDYVAATGDVKGGLQMQKQMKEYQRYKQLWNGKIPMFAGGKEWWEYAQDTGYMPDQKPITITSAEGVAPGFGTQQLPENAFTYMPDLVKDVQKYNVASPVGIMNKQPGDLTSIEKDKINDRIRQQKYEVQNDYINKLSSGVYDEPNVDAGSKRSSWVIPAALSALGIATAYNMRSKGEPHTSDTYAANPYEPQIRSIMSKRRANILDQIAAVRDAEARGRYAARTRGTSVGSYLPAMVAMNLGTQKNIANILAQGHNLNNQYLGEQANMDYQLGSGVAQRMMNSNQFRDSRYDRAAAMKYTLDNNAYAQMLGQAQHGYKNIFDLNKWSDTMGLYDRDYALRRDEARRAYV